MKVIIAGSRNVDDYKFVKQAVLDSGFDIREVVSGGARGVDQLGERYARENNLRLRRFEANWLRFKAAAGPIRNRDMVDYAEALIAIPLKNGISVGTRHIIAVAKKARIPVFVKEYEVIDANIPARGVDSASNP